MGWSASSGTGQQVETSPSYQLQDQTGNQSGSQSSSSRSTTTQQATNLPPEVLANAIAMLTQLTNGGTPQQRAEIANRLRVQQLVEGLLTDVSTGQAMQDSEAAMAQQLRVALEKQMPTIQRAIEGAGTSASSMQALLSQKLATESAQATGAVGADQAKSYANNRSQLASVLEALTRPQNTVDSTAVQLINALKGSVQSSSTTQNTSSQGSSSQNTTSSGTTFNSGGTQTTTPLYQQGSGGGSLDLGALLASQEFSNLIAGTMQGTGNQVAANPNQQAAPAYDYNSFDWESLGIPAGYSTQDTGFDW